MQRTALPYRAFSLTGLTSRHCSKAPKASASRLQMQYGDALP